ncbi:c-type cytochrome [candidate division KSB1 bacterium]
MLNIKNSYSRSYLKPALLMILAGSVLLAGCFRGRPSEKTPIHLNPNMDIQPKYKAQSESGLFRNGTNRTPVEGTVARGELRDNILYYTGNNSNGNFLIKSPVGITTENLKRGQERFNIYCTPCHSKTGDGKGIITHYNYTPPKSLHEQRLRDIEDGYIFDVITNGFQDMPAYRYQIPVEDRWAIVNYIRALQRSQNAKQQDVPEDIKDRTR